MIGKTLWIFLGLVMIAAVGFPGGTEEVPAIVDSHWLAQNLEEPTLRIIDFGRQPEEYAAGHIPGAVFVELEKFRATEFVDNWEQLEVQGEVPGMLPPLDYLVNVFEEAGINNQNRVVVYDSRGGLWASYLFWVLEYTGHKEAHVLSGGIKQWVKEERTLSQESVRIAPSQYRPQLQPEKLATKEYLLANLNGQAVSIVDVRSEGEYTGEILRSARGGHIPGALHIQWTNAVTDDEIKRFLLNDELQEFYASFGVSSDKEVVTHCQEGIRAAHTYLVLRNLGYEKVRVYDGSWFEWGNDPDTPIESGK